MKEQPLVSIIIPTYNREKYIWRAINSCLKQTYENIEVLVIDDCSTDSTKKVVTSILDSRVKYFKNRKNSWPCVSRNNWIKLSKWEYISFLDDDDELLSDKIELQLEKFKTSDIENLAVVTWWVKRERADINEIKYNKKKGNIYKDLLGSYCIFGTQSILIKKEILKWRIWFKDDLPSGQEYDFMLKIAKNYNFDYVDKIIALQNMSENQISFDFRKKIDWSRMLYHAYKNEFKKYWYSFWFYNFCRFKYLVIKYNIWLLIWKNIYNLLP